MKKHRIAVLVAICLGVALVAGLAAQNDETAASAQAPARWQHLAFEHDANRGTTDPELARRINRLGSDGWELVDVETVTRDGTTQNTVFYFKRPQR